METLIKDIDRFGRGRCKINDKITFVKNALPGETVDITITEENKKNNIGVVNKIIKENNMRVKPACKFYSLCGGCQLMHMSYEYELEFKKNKFKEIINRYVNFNYNIEIISSERLNYRNKLALHSDGNNLGFMMENTNEIINIDECLLASETINNYIKNKNIKEDITIRCNDKHEVISTHDNNYIIETINGINYRVDIDSFFQVNNYIISKIFDYITSNIDDEKVALDLYSGVGTLTIPISKKVSKVYSIEVNKHSFENAKYNMIINNVDNVILLLGKVEDKIKEIDEKVDLIVTDPPRSGMDTITVKTINKLKPSKIIYMSCEVTTLARDLKLLENLYNIKSIKVFDMFPNTYHVESVCVLEKK